MATDENISENEAAEILRELSDGKTNPVQFFTKIIRSDDTTKTGNLTSEELGTPNLPLRSLKELELFSRKVYQDDVWGDYFKELGEIQTSTSLSKDAILIKLINTIKKELSDTTPKEKKENKGWFKKKQ